jgi:hypothetical protein
MILGVPFFNAYHITLNRDEATVSFQLGCGCELSDDGYPKIEIGQNVSSSYNMGPGFDANIDIPNYVTKPSPNRSILANDSIESPQILKSYHGLPLFVIALYLIAF